MTRDPELSTLLAMEALHLRDTSQAEDSLRAALPGVQTVQTDPRQVDGQLGNVRSS